MTETEKLIAVEAIRSVKACYLRGVDTGDVALVQSILAEDCVLDYMGCCVDPKTGQDFMPAMNVVLKGRANFTSTPVSNGITTVHHTHNLEIEFSSDTSASAVWSMTDRLFLPSGSPISVMTGYGYYHDTYEKVDGDWKLKTTRIERLRVEAK